MALQQNSPFPAAVLPPRKQLAFALLIFERMLPSLLDFAKAIGRDDSCYLRAGDAAWRALEGYQDEPSCRLLSAACLRSAPDTEEFSHKLTSYALNAALAMSEIMEFILDGRASHIAYVSALATDSVDLYLCSRDQPGMTSAGQNAGSAADPLMRRELGRQEEDVGFLASLPDEFDKQAVFAVRSRANVQPPLLPIES